MNRDRVRAAIRDNMVKTFVMLNVTSKVSQRRRPTKKKGLAVEASIMKSGDRPVCCTILSEKTVDKKWTDAWTGIGIEIQ